MKGSLENQNGSFRALLRKPLIFLRVQASAKWLNVSVNSESHKRLENFYQIQIFSSNSQCIPHLVEKYNMLLNPWFILLDVMVAWLFYSTILIVSLSCKGIRKIAQQL